MKKEIILKLIVIYAVLVVTILVAGPTYKSLVFTTVAAEDEQLFAAGADFPEETQVVTPTTIPEPTATPIPTTTPMPTATPTPSPIPTPMPETPEEWYELALENGEVNGPQESHLNNYNGVFQGPNGRETFYNLNMNGIVSIMRNNGYSEEEYPYWVREDGCKMLGNYIMVAANLSTRPRGTIIETSLGTAIVCDTGSFVNSYPNGIDIAVNWVV